MSLRDTWIGIDAIERTVTELVKRCTSLERQQHQSDWHLRKGSLGHGYENAAGGVLAGHQEARRWDSSASEPIADRASETERLKIAPSIAGRMRDCPGQVCLDRLF